MTKFLIQAAVAVAVVTALGCADPELRMALPELPNCKTTGNAKDCKIPIYVIQTEGGCRLKWDAKQDEIAFPKGQKDKFIYWELVGPQGFIFTDDGIVIENNAPREFEKPKVLDKGRTFRWKNLHKLPTPKVYHYRINVTNTDGSITCTEDPKIHNE